MTAFNPDKDTLGADLLRSPTSPSKTAWQEFFGKFSTVPASKVVQAADVIRGLSGSWASQWWMGSSLQQGSLAPDPQIPPDQMFQTSHLGRPGMPEINFPPYSFNTNRFAHKGGALLGHPISFSVVGPTLKQGKYVNWQWKVEVGASNDILRLDTVVQDDDGTSTVWATNPWGQLTASVAALYGIDNADLDTTDPNRRFHGGLYVVVVHPGAPGDLTGAVVGGLGWGTVIPGSGTAAEPVSSDALWEIFRVVGIDIDTGLILDGGKRLSAYYGTPNGKIIRSIMLFEPAATRLVAVPGSGPLVGREQVFAVVPPERALNADGQMPYFMWKSATECEQPWDPATFASDGSLDPLIAGGVGTPTPWVGFEYANMPRLPIPRPKTKMDGTLQHTVVAPPWDDVGPGRMVISVAGPTAKAPLVGDILHVVNIKVVGAAALNRQASPDRGASLDSLLGWFEVVERCLPGGSVTLLVLRRIEEVDPAVGVPFWGDEGFFVATGSPDDIVLSFTVHDPVKKLWDSPSFDFDRVDSARLTNVIDPRWIERKTDREDGATGLDNQWNASTDGIGAHPQRADRAVFGTGESPALIGNLAQDPGSMFDLGFRVVLFPAKVKTVTVPNIPPASSIVYPPAVVDINYTTMDILVPDWSRPIESDEVLIDPAVTGERQYVEIDYANGFVRLSHAPSVLGGAFVPDGDVYSADDNPRKEMVIFACLVPYSMEKGQLGTGVRVASIPATLSSTSGGCSGGGSHLQTTTDQTDVWGWREWFTLQVGQTVGDASATIILEGLVADRIPPAGFVEILEGTGPDGIPPTNFESSPDWRACTFGYHMVMEDNSIPAAPVTKLIGCWGWPTGATFTPSALHPGVAILRREVMLPNTLDGNAGVPYAYDTTFGASKRATTLRFVNSELQVNADGSVTVFPLSDSASLDTEANLGDLFSSWTLRPGSISDNGAGTVTWGALTVIWQGLRRTIAAGSSTIDWATWSTRPAWLYVDGSDCSVKVSTSFPLSDPEYILIAMARWTGPGVFTSTDMQAALVDIDKRVDLYVGRTLYSGSWATYHPCFDTLQAAVEYASVIRNPPATTLPATSVPGPKVYIHVVGRTLETGQTIFGADGITIEGCPELFDDPVASVNQKAIVWAHVGDPLIDFNGHDDIVFDGVPFRYDGLAVDSPTPSSMLFGNTGSGSSRCVIRNCRLYGQTQGFLYSAGTTWTDCRFEDNWVEKVEDFGILMESGVMTPYLMGYPDHVSPDDVVGITVTGAPLVVTDPSGFSYSVVAGTPGKIVVINSASPPCLEFFEDAAGPVSFYILEHQSAKFTSGGVTVFQRAPGDSMTVQAGEYGVIFGMGDVGTYRGWVVASSETTKDTVIEGNTFIRDASPLQGMTPVTGSISQGETATLSWELYADVGNVTIAGHVLPQGAMATVHYLVGPPIIRVAYAAGPWTHDITLGDVYAYVTNDDPNGAGVFRFVGVGAPTPPASFTVTGSHAAMLLHRTDGVTTWAVATGPVSGVTGCGIGIFSDFMLPMSTSWADYIAAAMFNFNNRIVDNRIEGFHVGIWANNICYSTVDRNYVDETWNTGVVVGPWAVGTTVNENALNDVFKETPLHGGPFLYPGNNLWDTGTDVGIKQGILCAGLDGSVDNNNVTIGTGLPPHGAVVTTGTSGWTWQDRDIWVVYGINFKVRGNTTSSRIAGSGIYLNLSENWTPNLLLPAAYYSTLEANIVTDLEVTGGAGLKILGNQLSTGSVYGGICTIEGNHWQSMTLTGSFYDVVGNVGGFTSTTEPDKSDPALPVLSVTTGDRSTIVGNSFWMTRTVHGSGASPSPDLGESVTLILLTNCTNSSVQSNTLQLDILGTTTGGTIVLGSLGTENPQIGIQIVGGASSIAPIVSNNHVSVQVELLAGAHGAYTPVQSRLDFYGDLLGIDVAATNAVVEGNNVIFDLAEEIYSSFGAANTVTYYGDAVGIRVVGSKSIASGNRVSGTIHLGTVMSGGGPAGSGALELGGVGNDFDIAGLLCEGGYMTVDGNNLELLANFGDVSKALDPYTGTIFTGAHIFDREAGLMKRPDPGALAASDLNKMNSNHVLVMTGYANLNPMTAPNTFDVVNCWVGVFTDESQGYNLMNGNYAFGYSTWDMGAVPDPSSVNHWGIVVRTEGHPHIVGNWSTTLSQFGGGGPPPAASIVANKLSNLAGPGGVGWFGGALAAWAAPTYLNLNFLT